MDLTESLLSSAKHPIEGIAYLVYIGILLRWRFPNFWNKLLRGIKAQART